MLWLYRIGFGIDSVALLYCIYELFASTVFSRYPSAAVSNPILIAFLALGTIMGVAYFMHDTYPKLATFLLWIPAFPITLYGLFILLVILAKPNWR